VKKSGHRLRGGHFFYVLLLLEILCGSEPARESGLTFDIDIVIV